MIRDADSMPLRDTHTVQSLDDVCAAIRDAAGADEALYPLGGETSLGYGLEATSPGIGLSLRSLNKVIRYTPRDMTVTVEAGITVDELAQTLAAEGQQLPIDAAQPSVATIGGCVAINQSGSRRYAYGTLRDYIIGIQAVDGRGVAFRGGGNVVKNVAGYDFCKMHCGALGTLGVITELTFKVKPLPEQVVTVRIDLETPAVETVLATLATSQTTPAAIDLVAGPLWEQMAGWGINAGSSALFVRLEGTGDEVAWMQPCLRDEVSAHAQRTETCADPEAIRQTLTLFPADDAFATEPSPLIARIAIPPSQIVPTIAEIREWDPDCSVMAHAGSGIVVVRFHQFEEADLTQRLLADLQPAAIRRGGSCIVLASQYTGLTRQIVWGGRSSATELMERIREEFDPHHILNRGRFVY